MGGKSKREGISVCVWLIHSFVQWRLTQHCKATILQLKKKKDVVHIYTMEYYSAIKKEQNWVICRDVDGPREYHTILITMAI